MDQWLADFAFRVGIGPMPFSFALVIITIICAFNIGYKSYQAATVNPVEFLGEE